MWLILYRITVKTESGCTRVKKKEDENEDASFLDCPTDSAAVPREEFVFRGSGRGRCPRLEII